MPLVALMMASQPSEAQTNPIASVAADSASQDIATIRKFFELVESKNDFTQFDLARAADEAEQRLADWPATLPERRTLRAVIDLALWFNKANDRLKDNSFSGLNDFDLISEISNVIDYEHSPNSWKMVQIIKSSFNSGLFSMTRLGIFGKYREAFDENFVKYVEGLSIDTRFNETERMEFLANLGSYFAPSQAVYVEGKEVERQMLEVMGDEMPPEAKNGLGMMLPSEQDTLRGIDYYRRALKTARKLEAVDAVRSYTARIIEAALGLDPSGAKADALFTEIAAMSEPSWLASRSIYESRARIAQARGDWDKQLLFTGLWQSALDTDVRDANVPFWMMAGLSDAQISYLRAPFQARRPDLILDRFDKLAATVSIEGALDYAPIPEENSGQPEIDFGRTANLDAWGVDLVIAASPSRNPLGFSIASVLAMFKPNGAAIPMRPQASIEWAIVGTNVARKIGTTASSDLDPRVISSEFGRSLLGVLPEYTDVVANAAPILDIIKQEGELGEALSSKIPDYQDRFYAAFGRPIDDLAGGQCAASAELRGPRPRILLILPAGLSAFPMELARMPNGRYLIDCYEFRRASSPKIAETAASQWVGGDEFNGVRGIWNPDGDLEIAAEESVLIAGATPTGKVEQLRDRRALSVIAEGRRSDVLHLAGHGRISWFSPFESGVSIAPGQLLTYRDIKRAPRPVSPLLVVLSACEGGLTSPQGGEVAHWSMPTAFLDRGAGGVVAALWRVRDDAAALAMGKFYELLIKERLPPAAALRKAQLWLRDASKDELLDFVYHAEKATGLQASSLDAAITNAANISGRKNPYADPILWGAFAFFGTYPGSPTAN